jgi:hypothetical protein
VTKKQATGTLDAIRVSTLFVVGFTLSLVVVVQYGDMLYKINWAIVALVFLLSFGSFMLYRFNAKSGNKYDLLDLVMTKGVADADKHIVWLFAGLSAWVIVQKVLLDPRGDITGLLTLVLGTFVAKQAVGAIADAWKNRPAPQQGGGDVNVTGPGAAVDATTKGA